MLEAAAVEQSLFRLFQKIFVSAQTAAAAAAAEKATDGWLMLGSLT